MYVIYSRHHEEHRPPYQVHFGRVAPPSEVPDRVSAILHAVRTAGLGTVVEARSFPPEPIMEVHDVAYLEYLRSGISTPLTDPESRGKKLRALFPSTWPYGSAPDRRGSIMAAAGWYCFDTYTPVVEGTYRAAVGAAECALTGAELLLGGCDGAFALCRPPGHHAMRSKCGGYCYLNNAAIAACYLARGGRVAILDLDYHHGNGTQSIFYDTDQVLYVSLHADPDHAYPYFSGYPDERGEGKGLGYNLNLPLPPGTGEERYLETLAVALDRVESFGPWCLVVSLGFDTYREDPIADFRLERESFGRIAGSLAKLGLPTLFVLEGGYCLPALGELAVSFLRGWSAAAE